MIACTSTWKFSASAPWMKISLRADLSTISKPPRDDNGAAVDDGSVLDKTFRAGEKFRPVHTESRKMQYLYDSGDAAVFMDSQDYEQIEIPGEAIGADGEGQVGGLLGSHPEAARVGRISGDGAFAVDREKIEFQRGVVRDEAEKALEPRRAEARSALRFVGDGWPAEPDIDARLHDGR